MIQLADRQLRAEIADALSALQAQIDSKATFAEKTKVVAGLWKSKGGVEGKRAFEELKKELEALCVYVLVCNYCEQNEANDIEHIFPKSFFPEKAFVWDNYLLACKQCNSAYKLDKIHVLDDNDEVIEVKRKRKPPSTKVAFINPRVENPNSYLMLNMSSYEFEAIPNIPKADTNKATLTLQILQLNQRVTLIEARKSAARYYFDQLDRLRNLLKAPDTETIAALLNPEDKRFDLTLPLDVVKADILLGYEKHIRSYQHPSVWHGIKTIQAKFHPTWQRLFADIPEALDW